MAAVIGALRAELSASVATFEADMGKAAATVEKFAARFKRSGDQVSRTGQRLSLAITAPLLLFAKTAYDASKESGQALGQVEAALASMGNQSGKTSVDLQKSAKALQDLSLNDDDDILKKVTANLLTFGNVAGDVFDRAQVAAVNLSARLGQDLQSSAIQVGKALNDPVKGINALSRVGVQFTTEQKKMIKGFVASGQGAKAQAMILSELEREFGGAAKAMRDAAPAAVTVQKWRDFQEVVGGIIAQILPPVTSLLNGVLDAFNNLDPAVQKAVVLAGAFAAVTGPLLIGLGAVVNAVGALAPLWIALSTAFADAMLASGITSVAAAFGVLALELAPWLVLIGLVVKAVWEFRDVIGAAFAEVGANLKAFFSGDVAALFGEFKNLFAELMSGPVGEFFRWIGFALAAFAALFVRVFGHETVAVLRFMVRALTTAVGALADALDVVNKLLTGDFAGAWEAAKDGVGDAAGGMVHALEAIMPGIEREVAGLYRLVKTWIGDGIANVVAWIEKRVAMLPAAFGRAFGAAVAWAKSFYQGVKTWIGDNLGPLIKWAGDRINELAALLGRAKAMRDAAAHQDAPAPPAKAPPVPKPLGPQGAQNFDQGSAGAGGAANRVQAATKRLREALADINDAVSHGLDERALPKATAAAEDLRRKIADITQDAKQSGVSVKAFAGEIAALEKRIKELETVGLAEEATKFSREVDKNTRAVNAFSAGGLAPLEDALQSVDDAYESLRDKIADEIKANEVLAESDKTAAAAMARLKDQLVALDAAHVQATASARAQYAAEQTLADLRTKADNLQTSEQIRDLQQAAGKGGPMTAHAEKLQALESDLARTRIDAAIRLKELEAARDEANRKGDTAEAARLETQIDLQTEFYDLVGKTTAAQIDGANKAREAWQGFNSSLSDGIVQLAKGGDGAISTLKGAFDKLADDLFLKPGADMIADGIEGFMKKALGLGGDTGPAPTGAASDPLFVQNVAAGGGAGGLLGDLFGANDNAGPLSSAMPEGVDPIGDLLAAGDNAALKLGGVFKQNTQGGFLNGLKGLFGSLGGQGGGGSGLMGMIGGLFGGKGGGGGGGGIMSMIGGLFGGGGGGGGAAAGAGGGGMMSTIASFASSFLGGFDKGGRMNTGGWGVVGENGPELFAPSQSGYVIPSDEVEGRGGGVVQNWNIVTPDAESFALNQRQLARRAKQGIALG